MYLQCMHFAVKRMVAEVLYEVCRSQLFSALIERDEGRKV